MPVEIPNNCQELPSIAFHGDFEIRNQGTIKRKVMGEGRAGILEDATTFRTSKIEIVILCLFFFKLIAFLILAGLITENDNMGAPFLGQVN